MSENGLALAAAVSYFILGAFVVFVVVGWLLHVLHRLEDNHRSPRRRR